MSGAGAYDEAYAEPGVPRSHYRDALAALGERDRDHEVVEKVGVGGEVADELDPRR